MLKTTSRNKGKNEAKELIKRAEDGRAWLNRVAYRMYQEWQLKRWQTENSSQGSKWKPLTPQYKAYKLIRYGGGPKFKVGSKGKGRWEKNGNWPVYPGGGRKTMIATGTLVDSVTGKKLKFHRKIVKARNLIVGTTVSYADDANDKRNFTEFSQKNMDLLFKMYQQYILTGRMQL